MNFFSFLADKQETSKKRGLSDGQHHISVKIERSDNGRGSNGTRSLIVRRELKSFSDMNAIDYLIDHSRFLSLTGHFLISGKIPRLSKHRAKLDRVD